MHSQNLLQNRRGIAALETVKCKVDYICWHVMVSQGGRGDLSGWSKDRFCSVIKVALDGSKLLQKSFPMYVTIAAATFYIVA